MTTKTLKKARLLVVSEPPYFSAVCLNCGQIMGQDLHNGGEYNNKIYWHATTKIADLNGEPFKAYYHVECAAQLFTDGVSIQSVREKLQSQIMKADRNRLNKTNEYIEPLEVESRYYSS